MSEHESARSAYRTVLQGALDDAECDWFESPEDATERVLVALQAAGYYIACGDCNSSTNDIHYIGCTSHSGAESTS